MTTMGITVFQKHYPYRYFITSWTFLTDFIGLELISSRQRLFKNVKISFPCTSFAFLLCFERHLWLFRIMLARHSLSQDSEITKKKPLLYFKDKKKEKQENSYVKGGQLGLRNCFPAKHWGINNKDEKHSLAQALLTLAGKLTSAPFSSSREAMLLLP